MTYVFLCLTGVESSRLRRCESVRGQSRLFVGTDGFMWVHLDDSEVHYCKVLLDELFLRENFVAHITYERSGAAGLGLGGFVVNTGESILVYKKGQLPTRKTHSSQLLEPKTMKRYNNVLREFGSRRLVRQF